MPACRIDWSCSGCTQACVSNFSSGFWYANYQRAMICVVLNTAAECVRFGCHILTLVRQHTREGERDSDLRLSAAAVYQDLRACRNRVHPRNYSLLFGTAASSSPERPRSANSAPLYDRSKKRGGDENNLCDGHTAMHQNSCLRFLIYERRRAP